MAVVTATFHALGRTYVEGDEVSDSDAAVKRYPSFFAVEPRKAPARKASTRKAAAPAGD